MGCGPKTWSHYADKIFVKMVQDECVDILVRTVVDTKSTHLLMPRLVKLSLGRLPQEPMPEASGASVGKVGELNCV